MFNKNYLTAAIAVVSVSSLLGCDRSAEGAALKNEGIQFTTVNNGFFAHQKNLRKWGAPVVADLDRDGWPDVILNEHGFGVRIIWNNAGEFSQPFDLLMGDSHGVSVADFDQDGALEVIVSRGGGSGSNARNAIIYRVDSERNFDRLANFPDPLMNMRGRTVQFADLDHDGATDLLNFAFPSKERRGESENYLYRNAKDGTLSLAGHLNARVRGDGQRTLITDIDGDGQQDLLLYGNGPISLHRGKGGFEFEEVTDQWLPAKFKDVTGAAEIDFDNDGDFDLVLSRANAFESGETFFDEDTGTWGFYVRREAFEYDLAVGDLLELVNYQSPWPHRQIYIGESAYQYEFPGETHSGKTLTLVNSDSLGWPDRREEQGLHAGYIGNQTWRIGGNVWSPTVGVVKGLKKNPGSGIDQAKTSQRKVAPGNVLLENRDGKFVDITTSAGLDAPLNSTSVVVADLDNDGYQDLFFVQRGNLVTPTESMVYRNTGSGTFEVVHEHQVLSNDLAAWGLGGVAFDFDQDGKQDLLFGNEHGKWHLFKNNTASVGNHLTIDLGAPGSVNATPLDGILKGTACGKTQTQRVGSSSSGYERSFNRYVHFGLGDCGEPVQLEVNWTNGEHFVRDIVAFGKDKELVVTLN
ncbi:CRTAC1 family protein [Microbulbifer elongatus]|uniref:CRTAC1 family protein n=1 Tax=Microbulbifer elongatus TaxID=86173 RepID=UPI001CFD3FD8|nr:CRTAC1 family protein [Microbulbifer elongatus]